MLDIQALSSSGFSSPWHSQWHSQRGPAVPVCCTRPDSVTWKGDLNAVKFSISDPIFSRTLFRERERVRERERDRQTETGTERDRERQRERDSE
jgi:hypothetical protein